jgi:hypothetical protein
MKYIKAHHVQSEIYTCTSSVGALQTGQTSRASMESAYDCDTEDRFTEDCSYIQSDSFKAARPFAYELKLDSDRVIPKYPLAIVALPY